MNYQLRQNRDLSKTGSINIAARACTKADHMRSRDFQRLALLPNALVHKSGRQLGNFCARFTQHQMGAVRRIFRCNGLFAL